MRYIISLTSVPFRFKTSLPIIINELKKIKDVKIVLSLPKLYRKGWQWDLSEIEHLSDIEINVLDKDYGPATKLIGGIDWIKKNQIDVDGIITFDDDTIFNDLSMHLNDLLLNAKNRPNNVITVGGLKMLHPPYMHKNGIARSCESYVDSVAGYMGVFYPKIFWKTDEVFNLFNELDERFYSEDDAYFGGVCAKLKIPIWSMCSQILTKTLDNNDSAVERGYDENRIVRESFLYNQLIEKNILKIN